MGEIYALIYSMFLTSAVLVFIAITIFNWNTYAYERGWKKYLAINSIAGTYVVSSLACILADDTLLKELYTVIATTIAGAIVICLVLKAIIFMPKEIMGYTFDEYEDVIMTITLREGVMLYINLLKDNVDLLCRNRILITHNREYKAYRPEDISSIQVADVIVVYDGARWVKAG